MAGPGGREVVSGNIFVRFSSATDWTLVELPPGQSVAQGLAAWRGRPDVNAVEPNRFYRPNLTPGDPLIYSQYALSNVKAYAAWEYEVGTSSLVTVAVIDAGIQDGTDDLQGKIVAGASRSFDAASGAVIGSNPLSAVCNHATKVAGVAAATANNGTGIAGMSWGAKLISLKVFNDGDCTTDCTDAPGKSCGTSDAAIRAALDYAATLHNSPATGKIVANISLGEAGNCPAQTQTTVTAALNAGVFMVGAAGNDGGDVQTPAKCVGVIPVGATDQNNAIASFSSRGAALASYGLVAPGKDIMTTDLNDAYASASGTSFSAPMVAGAAALVWAAKPTMTPTEVRDTLRGSAVSIGVSSLGLGTRGNTAGAGLLDAFRAVRLAVNGTLSDFVGDREAIAFPNPFRPSRGSLTITVPLALQGSQTTVKIYNASGALVRQSVGQSWDGKNSEGVPAASGTYIFLVTTSKGEARGRFSLIR